jgi:hypothetical protein
LGQGAEDGDQARRKPTRYREIAIGPPWDVRLHDIEEGSGEEVGNVRSGGDVRQEMTPNLREASQTRKKAVRFAFPRRNNFAS